MSSTFTPAWDAGASRTAGNLLILWLANSGAVAGWSTAASVGGARIQYKIAAGGDAAPSVTCDNAQLAEFSGNNQSSPLDQTGSLNMASTSPQVVSTGIGGVPPDVSEGELVIYASFIIYTTAATKTLTSTLNNGATAHDTDNDSSSLLDHCNFGWGITTGNAAVDQNSLAFTTTKFGSGGMVIASFLLPTPPQVFIPTRMPLGV